MSELIGELDTERCQADRPNGQGPFTLGGGHRMVRCVNRPSWRVWETKPAKDGKMGQMTLCTECIAKLYEQNPGGGYEHEAIML